MKLAETYNLAIYVTNQVMANPAIMFGDPTTAIGGHILGHFCLSGDSLIQLADGSIKEIKDMNQGKVISGNLDKLELGNAESDKIFVNPNIKEVCNIITNSQIKCSKLHRFFTVDNFSITEKEAKELKKGDFVMQTGKLDIGGEKQKLPEINLRKIGKISGESSRQIKERLSEDKTTRREICEKIGIRERQFRRVLNQFCPADIETLNKIGNYFSGKLQLQFIPCYTHKHQNLNMPSIMTPELSGICGYFIGGGNLELSGLRFRDERHEVLECYKNLFKQTFNIDGNITKMKDKNCYTLCINSKEIRDFFALIMPEIFDYVGKSRDDVVRAFVRGFVDAEGSISKKRPEIKIAQMEEKILRHIQLFLIRLGIRSTIKFNVGKNKVATLRINDKDILSYLQIGFSAGDKQELLLRNAWKVKNTYSYEMMPIKRKDIWNLLNDCGLKPSKIIKARQEKYKWISRKELENAFNFLVNTEVKDRQIRQKINFILKILNSDIRFEKIREINVKENTDKEVFYDFSVPENENYIADGFVVHNSTYRMYLRRGKKGSRVAKLIDSPNLPENEVIFFVGKGGLRDEEMG